MRYRAIIAYDGTAYHGFQRQVGMPTIQSELESALDRVCGVAVGIVGSGRTDAGVHALGQVVAFNLEWHHSSSNLRNALNANLPDDIVIREIQEVSADFHPRYDALRRSYQYQLYIAPVRDPLRRLRAWRLARELDEVAICVAAKHLEGTHDFSTFGVPPRGENAVRTVYEVDWQSSPDGQYTFTIVANAFLYRMVRSVVATLVWVGKGHMTEKEFQGILAARQRSLAAPPAPPYGLTLVAVHFTD